MIKDYYEILGVGQNATTQEIKKQYHALSKKYHPDVNPENNEFEEKFKQINEAYSILSNEKKRKLYDETGSAEIKDPEKDAAELLTIIINNVISSNSVTANRFYQMVKTEIQTSEKNLESELKVCKERIELLNDISYKRCVKKINARVILINAIQNSIQNIKKRIEYLEYMGEVHIICLDIFEKDYFEKEFDEEPKTIRMVSFQIRNYDPFT